MFHPTALPVPIVGAPMAGGPSTPELTAAISDAGGFGILAGAYLSPDGLREQIARVRARTSAPFGVNLFVPEQIPFDAEAFATFRSRLLPLAQRFGAELPETVDYTDDRFDEKVAVLLDDPVAAVSFTFGAPDREVFAAFTERDVLTITTVTSPGEAEVAVAAGSTALCAQGVEAGGHRSTFHILDDDPELGALELLAAVAGTGVPVIGAGGVSGPGDVAAMLAAGAVAVQVGTLFLRTPEAGTRPAHRAALTDPQFTATQTTRAYSGRLARALVNRYLREHDASAPAIYPQINALTGPLRRAAADDPEAINLWAGTGWRGAREQSAAEVVRSLEPRP